MTRGHKVSAQERLFFGRHLELEVVARAVRASREGELQIVVVEGEPGIGKTAFLRRCMVDQHIGRVLAAIPPNQMANAVVVFA